jgi:3,4-dihydroxy 2-butanone 4-phosphate synthase/GTP cyclohydrolase II
MSQRVVSIEKAISDIRAGKMIILVDHEDRENEGDLCCAAELVTPEMINFMATYGRGLICMSLTEEKADALELKPMVQDNQSSFGTAFTKSIDAYRGVTTGISTQDRAHTILTAVAENAQPADIVSPGHVFPLRARPGGVLVRPGQTEGSVDVSRLAGLHPAGVICEIINDDGSMARMPDLIRFAEEHDLNIATIAALIQYRMEHEKLIYRVAETHHLPRSEGDIKVVTYLSNLTPDDVYIALIKGDIGPEDNVLVRIHRECFLGDFMGSLLCDCGSKLKSAREMISHEGKGVLLYVRKKDGGIGIHDDSDICCANDQGLDRAGPSQTLIFKREHLNCGVCAKILSDLGIKRVRSITSSPDNDATFETYGIELTERVPI